QRAGVPPLPPPRLRRPRRPPALLLGQRRGRAHHVAPGPSGGGVTGPILAIETSCDETAAAVVRERRVLSSIVASQAELHTPYGGVVPEVAARHHLGTVNGVVDRALEEAGLDLDDVAAVAVTQRPGLIAALLLCLAPAQP